MIICYNCSVWKFFKKLSETSHATYTYRIYSIIFVFYNMSCLDLVDLIFNGGTEQKRIVKRESPRVEIIIICVSHNYLVWNWMPEEWSQEGSYWWLSWRMSKCSQTASATTTRIFNSKTSSAIRSASIAQIYLPKWIWCRQFRFQYVGLLWVVFWTNNMQFNMTNIWALLPLTRSYSAVPRFQCSTCFLCKVFSLRCFTFILCRVLNVISDCLCLCLVCAWC